MQKKKTKKNKKKYIKYPWLNATIKITKSRILCTHAKKNSQTYVPTLGPLLVTWKIKRESRLLSQGAKAYSSLHRMKLLGALPHCYVGQQSITCHHCPFPTPTCILLGFTDTYLYSWVERVKVRLKNLVQPLNSKKRTRKNSPYNIYTKSSRKVMTLKKYFELRVYSLIW